MGKDAVGSHGQRVQSDPRWAQLAARDPHTDAAFVYAVSSTGIFCQPACPARLPRPEHVHFYASAEQARAAGFRPCRCCRPDGPSLQEQQASVIAAACRLMETSPGTAALGDLAAAAGMSVPHLHRLFRAFTGVTPKSYARAQRNVVMRERLLQSTSVTEAVYEADFEASSRFYALAGKSLGMTLSVFYAGGGDMEICFASGQSSLGVVLVGQTMRGLCAILLGDDREALVRELARQFPQAALLPGGAGQEKAVAQVIALVDRPALGLALPLDIQGTAFQQKVWQALCKLPPGTTASYAELAGSLGLPPSASRAVAQACAANTLAVAVPCHRVVRGDGGLAGYRWGVERKRALLAREAAQRP